MIERIGAAQVRCVKTGPGLWGSEHVHYTAYKGGNA